MTIQVDMFGSFQPGDRVAVRIPEDYPDGPLKHINGTLGTVEGAPFNNPGHYFVRVEINGKKPLWVIHASLLRFVGYEVQV
jgi:ribosomal protein L21E